MIGAQASANYAIQLGNGTNSTASTLAVGFNGTNYTLLDGTGLIPDARISSNIARTSAIPTVPTNISAFTNDSGYITSSALSNYVQATNGNITISNNGTTADIMYVDDASSPQELCGIQVGHTANGNGVVFVAADMTIPEYYFTTLTPIGFGIIDALNNQSALLTVSNNNLAVNGSEVATQSDLSSLANTDLSNLSATGKTVIDGQWVSKNQQIDTTTSVHTTKHNLGTTGTGALSYLPADCTTYDYEVFVSIYGATSSSGVSHGYAYNNSTSSSGQYGRVSCNANARHGNNSFALPIYNGEIWTSVQTTAFGSSFNVTLLGYRRLGTNS